jgi:hypothetical protein
MAAVKTHCPVTRDEFRKTAQTIKLQIGEIVLEADPREYEAKDGKGGSLGWNFNQKVTLLINGKRVQCQFGANITLVGSKELPKS